MNKLSITIDVNKIDKKRLQNRVIKKQDGTGYEAKEMKLEVIPLKERKVLSSGDTWELVKVGFVAEAPTKAEREAKTKTNIVGDATQFIDKNPVPSFERDSQGRPVGEKAVAEIDPNDIPF